MFCFIGYPGIPKTKKPGNPGFPPGTQWKVDNVAPIRARHGRFLIYTETTTKGNSGSPLYTYDTKTNKALVVGVHVGGHHIGNTSVPITYHLVPQEQIQGVSSTNSAQMLKSKSIIIFYHCFLREAIIITPPQSYTHWRNQNATYFMFRGQERRT